MKPKLVLKYSTFLILVILSLQFSLSPAMSSTDNNQQVSTNVWKLLDWNQANPTDWYSQGIYINATIGSLVKYNITSSSQNNMTDPNSGFFSIGNVSNIKTDDYDLANTFTLSIYPWSPGFAMNPYNWSLSESQASNAAKGKYLQGNLTITNNFNYSVAGFTRTAVKFVYAQNLTLGNQNTTLIYDFATGVLLYAKSAIFFSSLYKIELQLQSSTLITASNITTTTTTTTTPGFLIISPIFVLLAIIIFKKKKINR